MLRNLNQPPKAFEKRIIAPSAQPHELPPPAIQSALVVHPRHGGTHEQNEQDSRDAELVASSRVDPSTAREDGCDIYRLIAPDMNEQTRVGRPDALF